MPENSSSVDYAMEKASGPHFSGLRFDSLLSSSPPNPSVSSPSHLPSAVSSSSSPAPKQPFVIGVSGGTASGKTTVCDMIIQKLHDQRVVLINQDSFYRGLTTEELQRVQEYNFDHPDAFDTEQLLHCAKTLKSGQPYHGKCNLASVLGGFLVLTLLHNLLNVSGQNIPAVALFTFGDSNFDAGNKQTLTKANVAQGFWPYGKSRDDPNGKFSDGFITPDFVAKFMGIPIPIPAALKPNVNVSRGASFAVADATLLGAPVESLTLNQQVRKFNQMKAENWNDDFIKKSVFMIYIGANDYLNFTKNNPNADASAQQAFVTSVTNKLKNDISLLYSSGASKFVIQTLAPLGCLPIVRQDYNTGMDQCHELLNNLAKQHNEKIGPMLNELARTPGFQFTVFDFYSVILRRTQRPSNYRFFVTNASCCGVGTHNAYGCVLPNVHSKLCEYQRSYLFFDGRHNTEKAQESFGHLLFGADPNVIQPMNVRELVVYPVDEPMSEVWLPTTSAMVQASDSSSSASRGYEFY